MNGVKNELHVRLEQTARGIWYCSGLDIYAENHVDIGVEADLVMSVVEGVLMKHNTALPSSDKPVVLDVGFVELKGPRKVK
jgi:hypothetical protein